MTNQAVLDMCHQAYRSLKCFHGITHEVTRFRLHDDCPPAAHVDVSEAPGDMRCRSLSEIWYASPNLIRFVGNIDQMEWETELRSEEVICDGSVTWSRSIGLLPGWEQWRKQESTSMVLCSLSGTSGHALSTIPILLLEERVLWPIKDADSEAEVVEEAGRAMWRVRSLTDIGEVTYWVDQANGLLTSVHALSDVDRLRDPEARQQRRLNAHGIATTMTASADDDEEDDWDIPEMTVALETTETFKVVSLNDDLPASLFARPDGAPE